MKTAMSLIDIRESQITLDGPGRLHVVFDSDLIDCASLAASTAEAVEVQLWDKNDDVLLKGPFGPASESGELEGEELSAKGLAWLSGEELQHEVARWLAVHTSAAEKRASEASSASATPSSRRIPTTEEISAHDRDIDAWSTERERAEAAFIGKHRRFPGPGELESAGLRESPTAPWLVSNDTR